MSRTTNDPPAADPRVAHAAHLLAQVFALLMAPATATPDDLLPLADAARVGATSKRVLQAAIRAGDLPATGRQRDRSVRRADLERWIESRRVVHAPIDDPDIDRRIARIARLRAVNGAER